jgi:predicted RNA-binding Zn-ribbon protein involved in translation (DUF1610 family)
VLHRTEGDHMYEPQQGTVTRAKADDDEFVEFFRTGEHVTGPVECVACGYGALVRGALASCPMCGETLWERSNWSPFATALSGLRRIRR